MEAVNYIRLMYIQEEFRDKMIQRFESVMENEEAHNDLRELKQTGWVSRYTKNFQDLQIRLLTMTQEEAYSAYLSGMQPHLCE